MNPRLTLSNATRFIFNRWTILFVLTFSSYGLAQDGTGWTSYIDLIYTDDYQTPLEILPQCLAAAPDALTALECYHNLEIVDGEAFVDCQDEGLSEAACGKRLGYPTPFWPDDLGFIVEDVYQEIYNRYYANVVTYGWMELLPCLFSGCNGGCLAKAVAKIMKETYGSLNTQYWLEIFTASLYYLNSALWYQLPFPMYGTIVLPIFSTQRKLEQYAAYADSIDDIDEQDRGLAYTFTSPLFADLPVPYDPSETRRSYPGLYEFELLKDKLEPATLLEYQQFGFATIFEAYGDTELMEVTPLPCIGLLPIPGVRRAFTDWVTLPEGYEIPYTQETPWVPVANPTAILATDITKGLALDPSPPPVTSPTPIEEVLVCKPYTLADLAPINMLDYDEAIDFSGVAGNSQFTKVLQYLLRGYLLEKYDENTLALMATNGLELTPLEITGSLDSFTQTALDYFQGAENLPLSGVFDELTLVSLVSSSCPSDKGDTVFALQTALGLAGFEVPIDGIFDDSTRAALMAFQESRGLEATGNADLNTWMALFS
jgi:peptidoglycan hydrolase-like protein with peptidoglycan-binding domain